MWDPRAYQDTDFGLGDDESFEPAVMVEDDGAQSGPFAMTVLGPIEPDELGICLAFERVLQTPALNDETDRLDRIDLATSELEHLASLGGRTLVDVTLQTQDRYVAGLRQLTQRVPSHVIAATGAVHVDALDLATIERELDEGIDGTGIAPGVIVAGDALGSNGIGLLAGIAAARQYPLWVIASETAAATMTDWIGAAATWPSTVVWFPDHVPNQHDIAAVFDAGCSLGMTLAGKPVADIDRVNQVIAEAVAAGHGDRILISFGARIASDLVSHGGGPGWPYLLERWILDLMEHDIDSSVVRQILIENPARALTIGY